MIPEQDLGVGEFETEVRNRLLDHRHVTLIGAVHQDISLRRHNEERTERLGPHIIDIADDLVGWELRRLVCVRAHVAR